MSDAPMGSTPRAGNPLMAGAGGAAPVSRTQDRFWGRIYRIFSQIVASTWLQASLILALLGAAMFVMVQGRILWGVLLAVAGAAFGLSFVLRRMVGDEYGRT